MKRVVITIGGSHRQYDRQMRALTEIKRHGSPARIGIGSRRFHLIVDDTPELRQAITTVKGITISKWQPTWLNKEQPCTQPDN